MSREIKFRGKRVDNGEWVYGAPYFIPSEGVAFIINNCRSLNLTTEDSVFDGVRVDPATVGQYTGLNDKNGVEIYEGDVFTSEQYPFQDDGIANYNGVIEWIFSGFQYVLTCVNQDKRGISEGINEYLEDGRLVEVIGNIHEKGADQ